MAGRQEAQVDVVYADFARHCGPYQSRHAERWLRELLRHRLVSLIRHFERGIALQLIDPLRLAKCVERVDGAPTIRTTGLLS